MARASGGTMEHLEFFELPADPFQNDADARFYYESAPQKRARLRLLRGIHQRKALSVLVGGPGLGKTTLAHMLLRELEGKDYVAHYLSIPHEACSSAWFLPNVARAFGVPMPSPQVGQLVDQIHTQLVAIVTSKRAPVLLIDEAQLFRNREAMEEFRGMLNLLHGGKKLLSMVLFGLPELDDVLKLDEPLAQRVEIRVEMTAMDWLESQAYVSHRLRLAGATSAVFAPDALEALFRWSGGVPRVLNTLADNALFEGFLTETKPVDSPVVQAAAQSLGLVRVPSDTMPSIPPPALAAPDLLASTQVKLPPHPARAARPEPGLATMPVAKLSPRPRAPEPEPEEDLAEELELAPTAEPDVEPAAAESDPSPDWLEPLSPMPEDVPVEPEPTPERVEEEPLLDAHSAAELDLDLEEVVAEDTLPPTPVRAIRVPESEPELAAEPAEAELDLGSDDDDDEPDFTFGSLVNEEDSDLAPARRTAPAPRPATPAAAKPVAAPKPATPAKPRPATPATSDDSFDLRNLVTEDDDAPALAPRSAKKVLTTPPPTPAPRPVPAKPAAAAEKDSDDDGLDALFDEIQIGD